MPPALAIFLALGWIERAWLRPPAARPPQQVDTRLPDGHLRRTVADAVVIEADPEPFHPAADEIAASADSLAKVRDDTVFRPDDEEAWFQTWLTLRSADPESLRRSDARPVSFIELYSQPRSFRGRLVRFKGTVHRLARVEAPANGYDITGYWQAWIEPADGPASPIVVYFLELPPGMPTGMRVREPVEVVGYFFKRWAYEAKDAIRMAPLVMALKPAWRPLPQAAPGGTAVGGYALLAMAGLVGATLLAKWFATAGPLQRQPAPPDNLSATLADAEIVSPGAALDRLAAAERPLAPPPVPEEFPR